MWLLFSTVLVHCRAKVCQSYITDHFMLKTSCWLMFLLMCWAAPSFNTIGVLIQCHIWIKQAWKTLVTVPLASVRWPTAQFQAQVFSPSNKFLTWCSCSVSSVGAPFWSSFSFIYGNNILGQTWVTFLSVRWQLLLNVSGSVWIFTMHILNLTQDLGTSQKTSTSCS